MPKDVMTDEEVEIEIERLSHSDAVVLARKERQYKNRRRQYMYQLRWFEKRGTELMKQGVSLADFNFDEQEGM